ncbi:MAG: hypothetical protein JXR86_14115 [Spirochaetales bacterium]|nr:hypothetical protein [Spirochaetales bacterium]
MRRIILSGIKHSGKSTVGWAVASQLGLFFADLDDLILRDAEHFSSVRELFRSQGADGFKKQEYESLKHFLLGNEGKEFVLSLGGGTIENSPALTLLKRNDITTYYLDADERDLYNRIVRGGIPPFLESEDPGEKFGELYKRRAELYKNWASCIIDTRGKTPAEITSQIILSQNYT